MNRQLPLEADQLGEPQAEYTANRLTAKILLGAGIVCGLISLLPLYTAVSKFLSPPSRFLSDSFRQDSIMIGGSIGLFLLLLTVLFFVYHRYHTSLRVVVYSEGFVFNDWRQSLACRWDEVTELYESVTRSMDQRGWERGPKRYAYTVYLTDGRRIKIAGLEGIILLGRKLKVEIPRRVQRQALQVYQAGGTVWFGPKLNLSWQGISDGKKILPWSEVAEVKVSGEDNSVTIQQEGRRMRWKYVYGPYVANPWVLQEMVNRIHTLNRSSEQSAAGQELLHFPPNFPARRARELKRRRVMIGVAAAILLVGVLVGGGYVVMQQLQSRTSLKIRDGLENICADAGDRVPEVSPYTQTSGLHPVQYVDQTAFGWLLTTAPWKWHPQEITDTELVACLVAERVEIERCPYTVRLSLWVF